MRNDVSFLIPADKKDATRAAYAHDTVVGDTAAYSHGNLVDAGQFRGYCRDEPDIHADVVESAGSTHLAGLDDRYGTDEERSLLDLHNGA